jgi:hypothetical protein
MSITITIIKIIHQKLSLNDYKLLLPNKHVLNELCIDHYKNIDLDASDDDFDNADPNNIYKKIERMTETYKKWNIYYSDGEKKIMIMGFPGDAFVYMLFESDFSEVDMNDPYYICLKDYLKTITNDDMDYEEDMFYDDCAGEFDMSKNMLCILSYDKLVSYDKILDNELNFVDDMESYQITESTCFNRNILPSRRYHQLFLEHLAKNKNKWNMYCKKSLRINKDIDIDIVQYYFHSNNEWQTKFIRKYGQEIILA